MDPETALTDALAGFGGPRHAAAVAQVVALASQAVMRGASGWAGDALARALAKAPTDANLLSRFAGIARFHGDTTSAWYSGPEVPPDGGIDIDGVAR